MSIFDDIYEGVPHTSMSQEILLNKTYTNETKALYIPFLFTFDMQMVINIHHYLRKL